MVRRDGQGLTATTADPLMTLSSGVDGSAGSRAAFSAVLGEGMAACESPTSAAGGPPFDPVRPSSLPTDGAGLTSS